MDWVLFLSFGVTLIGGVVWAVRLEGRVNQQDALLVERDKQTTERHADMKDRLERIENKLDSLPARMNGRT